MEDTTTTPKQKPATPLRPQRPPKPSRDEVATKIADALGEDKKGPRAQIKHIVWALGRYQSQQLMQEALKIRAEGGMKTQKGDRDKSVGGIFFWLAYSKGKARPGRELKQWLHGGKKQVIQEQGKTEEEKEQQQEAGKDERGKEAEGKEQ